MLPAVAAALLVLPALATAVGAEESELWFRNVERKTLAQTLRARGYRCPELQAGFRVGSEPDGNHIRLVCNGRGGQSDDATMFRLVARGSGISRLEPWNQVILAAEGLRPSLE